MKCLMTSDVALLHFGIYQKELKPVCQHISSSLSPLHGNGDQNTQSI